MFSPDFSGQAPRILVFAGPNGSGKSTVTKQAQMVGAYINADAIKAERHCTDLEAAQEAEKLRELSLKFRLDFTFETVLSTKRNLDLLRRAKEAGYHVLCIFVLTNDPQINVQRVMERVSAGGHDVPIEKITSRYHRSLANLPELVRISNETYIIDNSGNEPARICTVIGRNAEVCPNEYWSEKAILELLDPKQPE